MLVNDGMLGGMFADILANALYAELLGKAASAEEGATARQQIARRVAMGRQRLAEDLERRAGRAQELPRPLAAYAGTYENEAMGRLDCRVVDDRLEIAYGLARAEAEVYEAATHKLRVELTGRGEVVTFAPAESGHDTAPMASLTWGGRLFQRVDG